MRACLPALGADQFDGDNPSEASQQSSFFNWFALFLSIGSIAGLILIVWLENTKGWDLGFGLSALLLLLGLLVSAAGVPFYRNRVPQGSPLTRVLQVLVVAFKNRKLVVVPAENVEEEAQEDSNGGSVDDSQDKVPRLTKNDLNCTVAQVPNPLLVAFTVQQGMTTDTRLGSVHVYPAMLFVIPSIFQALMLVAYDRLLVPLVRSRTGYSRGVTHLQRVGVGFLATFVAPAVAAVVEGKRKAMAADAGAGGRMSLFWLSPQFFLIGVADTTSFVGLLEFFNAEAPRGMKSIGVALFWCQIGMASLLGTLLVRLVNAVTRRGGIHGWLEGADLNSSHLDRFYWVVAVVAFIGWLNFLYWAKRYTYRHDPQVDANKSSADDEEDNPMAMP